MGFAVTQAHLESRYLNRLSMSFRIYQVDIMDEKDKRYAVPSFLNYRNSLSEIRVGVSTSVPLHGEVEGGVKSDSNILIKASTEDKELWGKATGFSYGLGASELPVYYHPGRNRSNPQGCSERLCELTTVQECLGKGRVWPDVQLTLWVPIHERWGGTALAQRQYMS